MLMLDRRTFVVRERVAFMKLSDTYDILDAESGAVIGIAQERISGLVLFATFSGDSAAGSAVIASSHFVIVSRAIGARFTVAVFSREAARSATQIT